MQVKHLQASIRELEDSAGHREAYAASNSYAKTWEVQRQRDAAEACHKEAEAAKAAMFQAKGELSKCKAVAEEQALQVAHHSNLYNRHQSFHTEEVSGLRRAEQQAR